jgi:hypothetical protein
LVITTKVAKASSKPPSVRTTIPEEIVPELSIGASDALVWNVTIVDGKTGVFVRKA